MLDNSICRHAYCYDVNIKCKEMVIIVSREARRRLEAPAIIKIQNRVLKIGDSSPPIPASSK